METKTYLSRYLITLDQYGQPIRLRRNGNATTYKAFDGQSSREVALEVIPAGTLKLSVQSKLEAEAETAKQIKQINIPMLYDFGIENNELIYAMEMVDGVTAEDWVKTHGPMPLGSALRIASQLVNALRAATFHGVFHHALSPANIMIVPGQTAEGEWPLVKVMNFFGLAPSYSSAQASAAGVNEEVNFVAPEQLETGTADFRTEVYSLGCTLWFLLSGVPPLAGAATVENASRVPAPVRRLLSQMLAIDPRDRPFDPVALHAHIEDCIAEVENRRVVPPPKAVIGPAAVAAAAAVTKGAPGTTTAVIDPRPRRPFPWQPLAVAAVLLAFAGVAMAILPKAFRSKTASQDQIGVPIGVPESSSAPATNSRTQTAAAMPAVATPAVAAATAAPATGPANTQVAAVSPGVLTSTAQPNETDDSSATSDTDDAPAEAPESARVASASTSPLPVTTATSAPFTQRAESSPAQQGVAATIASNTASQPETAEPPAPAEGPADELPTSASTNDAPALYANSSPDGNARADQPAAIRDEPARVVSRREAPARSETKPREKTKAVAKAEKRVPKKERVVAAAPAVPEGRVRAEFLGTTPEGELIFGLPADQRGYLAPPAAPKRERSRRAKRSAVLPAEPAGELPVLPALPADE